MLPFLNPLPILLTLTTLFGVFFHDTQFDHAASISLTPATSMTDYGSVETALRMSDQHIHTERTFVSTSTPSSAPRLLEDKKYILQNRMASMNTDSDYHWPVLSGEPALL